jgi:hypothetical protein
MPKAGMYTPATMARNLSQGNIGEAMLRLWCENHAALFKNTRVVQTGYNPLGIVPVVEKPWLSDASDPDFALARTNSSGAAAEILFGISTNAQQSLYFIQSTSGGFCGIRLNATSPAERRQHCPLMFECHDRRPELGRIWYNRPNIENDYPRFQAKSGARDTILVTFISRHPSRVAKWLKDLPESDRKRLEIAIWHYLKSGSADHPDSAALEQFLRRLVYSTRKSPVLTDFGIRWYWLSEIQSQAVPSWLTGGLSNNGRPPMKYCVPAGASRTEQDLIAVFTAADGQSVT